ncbi:hypothetical protein [Nitrospira lenta]|uniref:Lipoprotein n=1 Tax=Nitrospira lenta TaxID=1436998 RepID=A0A330L917_9BACT|nr:hypothetical protein [Nitrospira lenta]SPP65581.1 conserved exported hypothetical protein [Nitrospira lenta]
MKVFLLLIPLVLAACAEGRWVHATKTDAQSREDWEVCKSEVLLGQEHAKVSPAGGINLSGCMQSKGYRYAEQPPSQNPHADTRAPQ